MMKTYFYFFSLLLLPFVGFSQILIPIEADSAEIVSGDFVSEGFVSEDSFPIDTAFIRRQEAVYQKWMDDNGLGKTLKVHSTTIDNSDVSLYLAFQYDNLDSILVAWDTLKTIYERQRHIKLEEQLFYKMTQILHVDQFRSNVQLFNTYYVSEPSLFYRGIYFDEGEVKIETSDPQSIITGFPIDPGDFKGMKNLRPAEIKKLFPKVFVLDTIFSFVKKNYELKKCPGYKPIVKLRESKNLLRFEVDNLCKEVFDKETNDLLCRILNRLGFHCNHLKRERLYFIITHKEVKDGIRITCEIDGEYTSSTAINEHNYLSMEDDEFIRYFELYADIFTEEIRRMLLKIK